MNVASRVRRAWSHLIGQLHSADDPSTYVLALRDWLRNSAREVSKKTENLLESSSGVALVLNGNPEHLPLPEDAIADIEAYKPPADPARFAEDVGKLCWGLGVYRREDDCCSSCQGDLEYWVSEGDRFDVCDLLGCTFDERGESHEALPTSARPANRSEVLARYPKAALMLSRRKKKEVAATWFARLLRKIFRRIRKTSAG